MALLRLVFGGKHSPPTTGKDHCATASNKVPGGHLVRKLRNFGLVTRHAINYRIAFTKYKKK